LLISHSYPFAFAIHPSERTRRRSWFSQGFFPIGDELLVRLGDWPPEAGRWDGDGAEGEWDEFFFSNAMFWQCGDLPVFPQTVRIDEFFLLLRFD